MLKAVRARKQKDKKARPVSEQADRALLLSQSTRSQTESSTTAPAMRSSQPTATDATKEAPSVLETQPMMHIPAGTAVMELSLLSGRDFLGVLFPTAIIMSRKSPSSIDDSLHLSGVSESWEAMRLPFVQQLAASQNLRSELEILASDLRVSLRSTLDESLVLNPESRIATMYMSLLATIERYASTQRQELRVAIEQELAVLVRYGSELVGSSLLEEIKKDTSLPSSSSSSSSSPSPSSSSRSSLSFPSSISNPLTIAGLASLAFDRLAANPLIHNWRAGLLDNRIDVLPPAREAHFRHCFFRPLPPFTLPPAAQPYDREWHHNHARWCLNLACLVYMDDADSSSISERVLGLNVHTFIESTETGTQACVYGNDTVTIVAFRGTESSEDWRTNQDYKLVPLFDRNIDRGSPPLPSSASPPLSSASSPLGRAPIRPHSLMPPSPSPFFTVSSPPQQAGTPTSPALSPMHSAGRQAAGILPSLSPTPAGINAQDVLTPVFGDAPNLKSPAAMKARRRSTFAPFSVDEILQASEQASGDLLVHRGFKGAYSSISEQIESLVAQRPNTLLYLTGHSLGGALATMCLAHFLLRDTPIPVCGVYTFGQPRVGNPAFEVTLTAACNRYGRLFRCINSTDIVPKLPPGAFGFKHTGKTVLITSQKELNPTPSRELFRAEHSRVAGQLVNHTKNEYLACLELISLQEPSTWAHPQSKARIVVHGLRYFDAVQSYTAVLRFGSYSWTAVQQSTSFPQLSFTFELPEVHESDELIIEILDKSKDSKLCATAIVGFDAFDNLTDARFPLTPAAGFEDVVSATACIVLDMKYWPIPRLPTTDLNADCRLLTLTLHELTGMESSANLPADFLFTVIVRHRGCEWAAQSPSSAFHDISFRLQRVNLGDQLELEVLATTGGRTAVFGRACFDVLPRFVDLNRCTWALRPALDPDPNTTYLIQGRVLLSLNFQRLPQQPVETARRVATATITVHDPINLPERVSEKGSAEREFVIRGYHGVQSWVSPLLKLTPAKPWNYSFVISKLMTSSPLELELFEVTSSGKQDYVGRVLFHSPSLVDDIVELDHPLVLGRRINTRCAGAGGQLADASCFGVYAPSPLFRGSLRLSFELKPCVDVVRRRVQLSTGKTRILKIEVQLPRFMRELGVQQKVSVPITPESTVSAAISVIEKKLVLSLGEHDREVVRRTLAFFQLGIHREDSSSPRVKFFQGDVSLWNIRPSARLVYRSTDFKQQQSLSASSSSSAQVTLRVHVPIWEPLINVAFLSLSVDDSETTRTVIKKLVHKLSLLIVSDTERALVLQQGSSYSLFSHDELNNVVELSDKTEVRRFASSQRLTLTTSARGTSVVRGSVDGRLTTERTTIEEKAIGVNATPEAAVRQASKLEAKAVLSHKTWLLQSLDGKTSDSPRNFLHLQAPETTDAPSRCALITLDGQLLPIPSWTPFKLPLTDRVMVSECFEHRGEVRLVCIMQNNQFIVADMASALNPSLFNEPLGWSPQAVAGWLSLHGLSHLTDASLRNGISGGSLIRDTPDELADKLCCTLDERTRLTAAYHALVSGLGSGQRYLPSPPALSSPRGSSNSSSTTTTTTCETLPAILTGQHSHLEAMRGAYARSMTVVIVDDVPQLWMGIVLAGRDFLDESGQVIIVDALTGQAHSPIFLPHAVSAMCRAETRVWVGGAGRLSTIEVDGAHSVSQPIFLSSADDTCTSLCFVSTANGGAEVWCGSAAALSIYDARSCELLDRRTDSAGITQIRVVSPEIVCTASPHSCGLLIWDSLARQQLQALSLPREFGSCKVFGTSSTKTTQDTFQLWCATTSLVVCTWSVTIQRPSQASIVEAPASPAPSDLNSSSPDCDRERRLKERVESLRLRRRLSQQVENSDQA